jgi:sterol desaturase/sphingolipid hydroxylase (fatty acid hydroxylase superfamily)
MVGAFISGGALIGFLLLSFFLPRDRSQGVVTGDTAINVANGLLLFGLKLTGITWVASRLQIGWMEASVLSHPFLQFLAAFFLLDFSRYWLHRAHHRLPWLWFFHRVHHMTERLDATAGLRMHIVDFIQLSLLPVLLFSALLNTSSWAAWVLPAALAVGVLFDAFEHANLRWHPQHPGARIWGTVFNHPHFHAWHHTKDGARCDGNYGNALVIWDRVFGSDVTGDELPEAYGLEPDQALVNGIVAMQCLKRQRT